MQLLANGLRMGCFVTLVMWPTAIALPIILVAPFRGGWYLLIAHKLWRLGSASWQDGNRQSGQA